MLAELLHFAKKTALARSLAVAEEFCSRLEVLPYGPKAAQNYGSIRSALEKQGHPIDINGLNIADHAQLGDLTPTPPHSSPCTSPLCKTGTAP